MSEGTRAGLTLVPSGSRGRGFVIRDGNGHDVTLIIDGRYVRDTREAVQALLTLANDALTMGDQE